MILDLRPEEVAGGSSSDSQVLFLAMGYPYLAMAINAAQSVRQTGTKANIKLITNYPVRRIRVCDVDVFDIIETLDRVTDENRWVKTRIIDRADGAKNILLDCDVEVKAPLNPLMGLLNNFDVAARNLPFENKNKLPYAGDLEVRAMALSEINTGVILFNKSAGARELFDLWHQNFLQLGTPRDQPSFLKALLETRTTRFFPLPPMWNATPWSNIDLRAMRRRPSAIRILHYRDPSFWPSVALRLAESYRTTVIDLLHPSAAFSAERNEYAHIVRRYRNPLYKHPLGRFWLGIGLSRTGRSLRKVEKRKIPKSDA